MQASTEPPSGFPDVDRRPRPQQLTGGMSGTRIADAADALSPGPPRTIEADTDLYHATFTAKGARLLSFRLKRYRETVRKDSPLYDVVVQGERLPLGLIVNRDGKIFADSGVDYTTDAPAQVESARATTPRPSRFTADTREGLKLTKRFIFRNGRYLYDVDAEVGGATSDVKAIGFTMSQPLTERAPEQGYRDYPALEADVAGKVLNEYQKQLEKGLAPVDWRYRLRRYWRSLFSFRLHPQGADQGRAADGVQRGRGAGGGAVSRSAEGFDRGLHGAQAAQFAGGREPDAEQGNQLRLVRAAGGRFSTRAATPAYHRAELRLGHHIADARGAAGTLPASIKAQRSALRMQRLAPQVEKIRAKFKDDSTALNREMMELYKRNHVNPLGGCLPTAIQFPILYGLYEALLNSVELRHAPFIFWIRDLSAPDCLPIAWMPKVPGIDCHGLPIVVLLMGVSTFAQQWMMPKAGDPNQQKMMMWMPIFFTVLFIALPAGLSLYYFASNVLGIIQQFFLNREFKQYTPVAAA